MAPLRLVSHRQLELLVEFAEQNKTLALNNCKNGPLGQLQNEKAWEKLAMRLNSIGEGASKDGNKWKRYWHVLKCRTKGKAADNRRRNQRGTGGGPNKFVPLTDLEERIASLIGPVAVEGDPEVRIPVNFHDEVAEFVEVTIEASNEEGTDTSKNTETEPVHAPPEVHEIETEADVFVRPESTQAPSGSGSGVPIQPVRRHRPSNHDNVPRWAYDMDLRHIAAEERLADTVERIEVLLHQIVASQATIVDLLQGRQYPPQ